MGGELLITLLTASVGGSAPGRWAWFPTHNLTSAGLQRKVQLRISDLQLKEFHICRKNSFSVPFLAWDIWNGCCTDYLRGLQSLRPCHLDEPLLSALFASLSLLPFLLSLLPCTSTVFPCGACALVLPRRHLETQPKAAEVQYCEEGKCQYDRLLNFLLPPDSGSRGSGYGTEELLIPSSNWKCPGWIHSAHNYHFPYYGCLWQTASRISPSLRVWFWPYTSYVYQISAPLLSLAPIHNKPNRPPNSTTEIVSG